MFFSFSSIFFGTFFYIGLNSKAENSCRYKIGNAGHPIFAKIKSKLFQDNF